MRRNPKTVESSGNCNHAGGSVAPIADEKQPNCSVKTSRMPSRHSERRAAGTRSAAAARSAGAMRPARPASRSHAGGLPPVRATDWPHLHTQSAARGGRAGEQDEQDLLNLRMNKSVPERDRDRLDLLVRLGMFLPKATRDCLHLLSRVVQRVSIRQLPPRTLSDLVTRSCRLRSGNCINGSQILVRGAVRRYNASKRRRRSWTAGRSRGRCGRRWPDRVRSGSSRPSR